MSALVELEPGFDPGHVKAPEPMLLGEFYEDVCVHYCHRVNLKITVVFFENSNTLNPDSASDNDGGCSQTVLIHDSYLFIFKKHLVCFGEAEFIMDKWMLKVTSIYLIWMYLM